MVQVVLRSETASNPHLFSVELLRYPLPSHWTIFMLHSGLNSFGFFSLCWSGTSVHHYSIILGIVLIFSYWSLLFSKFVYSFLLVEYILQKLPEKGFLKGKILSWDMSKNIAILPLHVTKYKIYFGKLFPFRIWKELFHCLLFSCAAAENPMIIWVTHF